MKKHLAIILSLVLLTGCAGNSVPAENNVQTQSETAEVSDNIYYLDAVDVVNMAEATHPAYVTKLRLAENYDDIKAEFLEKAKTIDNIDDFEYALRKYMVAYNDIHTNIIPHEGSKMAEACSTFLDIDYTEHNGELVLCSEDGVPTQSVIESVGGVSIEELYKTIEEYFPLENDEARSFTRSVNCLSLFVCELSGCEIKDNAAEVVCSDKTFTAEFIKPEADTTPEEEPVTLSAEMRGDILYIDFNKFEADENFQKGLEDIKNAVDGGAKKVILDMRDNRGGLIMLSQNVAGALDIGLPVMGWRARRSSADFEAIKDNIEEQIADTSFGEYPSSLLSARPNPDLDIAVLCSRNTWSAGIIMCALMQDGKLGTIIGRSPREAVNMMGTRLDYDLPNTGTHVMLSGGYFYRPDENADPDMLIPDIKVEEGTDILDYTIHEYFKE